MNLSYYVSACSTGMIVDRTRLGIPSQQPIVSANHVSVENLYRHVTGWHHWLPAKVPEPNPVS